MSTMRAFVLSLLLIGALLPLRAAAADPVVLPEGEGRAAVAAHCVQCHDLSRLRTSGGHTEEGWRNTLAMMLQAGSTLPRERVDTVARYLAANFPQQARPVGTATGAAGSVSIQEWDVPTKGSRPHDPMAARDGTLWYTGQFANVLGRLDPATGKFREYPLRTPQSGPHGLAEDRAGNVWFTANFKAYIGKLDPRTGAVVEYPMPDARARDPHTLVIDRRGTIWFTVQNGNMVGRLDPASGAVKLVPLVTPAARPYGILVDSRDVPWFVEFGANKVGRIDPATLAIREYVLPHQDSRPRRIAITSDDAVWYTDYARGAIGRLDPVSGAVEEWPSPAGADSQPYGMVAIGDTIWYSESGAEPNTLVRFERKGARFETWPIPSGGGVVRNMDAMQNGDIALACSGVNKVGLVRVH